ncbi:hypothetical protein L228DRAFT_241840 [Xylona heveae TC161]|uniref:Uncharacterized protein n=1 Tax=Xylona heveae (strain CBS 132557 / TC161) TaxID=1328760 RepID=A0A164ZJ77_XYLHT|nr:hypothetical protein L228DRAFT_241840 [Xylona heveae TC161]KZF19164.1 hypothetical protein L228DRAFT_241840 [Xylona heveae TC161]
MAGLSRRNLNEVERFTMHTGSELTDLRGFSHPVEDQSETLLRRFLEDPDIKKSEVSRDDEKLKGRKRHQRQQRPRKRGKERQPVHISQIFRTTWKRKGYTSTIILTKRIQKHKSLRIGKISSTYQQSDARSFTDKIEKGRFTQPFLRQLNTSDEPLNRKKPQDNPYQTPFRSYCRQKHPRTRKVWKRGKDIEHISAAARFHVEKKELKDFIFTYCTRRTGWLGYRVG